MTKYKVLITTTASDGCGMAVSTSIAEFDIVAEANLAIFKINSRLSRDIGNNAFAFKQTAIALNFEETDE